MCETRQLNRPAEDGERRPVRRYRLQEDREGNAEGFTKIHPRRQYGGRGMPNRRGAGNVVSEQNM
jgi:hypothetical protein